MDREEVIGKIIKLNPKKSEAIEWIIGFLDYAMDEATKLYEVEIVPRLIKKGNIIKTSCKKPIMWRKKDIKILEMAVKKFGDYDRFDLAIEEMSELTKALIKFKRYEINSQMKTGLKHDVIEEMADVYIMLEQLKLIFDKKENQIKEQIIRKMDRLETYV